MFRLLKHLAVLIAAVSFSAHALIPLGFMPDPMQPLALMACDGVDHSMHMGHMHHHGGDNHPCPFSIGAAFDHAVSAFVPAAQPVFAGALLPPALTSEPQRPSFSNASPRSPPLYS